MAKKTIIMVSILRYTDSHHWNLNLDKLTCCVRSPWILVAGNPLMVNQCSNASAPFFVSTNTSVNCCCRINKNQLMRCKSYRQTTKYSNGIRLNIKSPCHLHHLPSVHAEGPLGDFSCRLHPQIQPFELSNQCLNPPFQQPEKCNSTENQMPVSAHWRTYG